MLEVDAVNQQDEPVDLQPLQSAVRQILVDADIRSGSVNIAVVDDPTIHRLNRQHLNHDYPTDVLSFLLEEGEASLDGEIVVSLDTAAREAEHWRWATELELLLYVVHGALHLVGYDDHSEEDRAAMQARERLYFQKLGKPIPPGREATGEPHDA